MPHSGARSRVAIACRSFSGALAGSSSRAAGCAGALSWRTQPGQQNCCGGKGALHSRITAEGRQRIAPRQGRRAGWLCRLFLCGAWAVRTSYHWHRNAEGRKSPACPTQLSGVARELPPPQVAPENCLHRRWRQRVASTAGGFIDKIFGWVYNNAVCCRGFPALDSKQRSVTP